MRGSSLTAYLTSYPLRSNKTKSDTPAPRAPHHALRICPCPSTRSQLTPLRHIRQRLEAPNPGRRRPPYVQAPLFPGQRVRPLTTLRPTACAAQCLTAASMSPMVCSAGNEQCLCSSPAYVGSVESCIEGSCTLSDVNAALQAVEELCTQAVSAPLVLAW